MTMRVLLFFAWFIGFGIGVPAIAMGIARLWAVKPYIFHKELIAVTGGTFVNAQAVLGEDTVVPPTDARAAFPMAEAAAMAIYPDNTRTLLIRCSDVPTRQAAAGHYMHQSGAGTTTQDHDGTRFKTASGEVSWTYADGGDMLIVTGPTREAMDARRWSNPVFRKNTQANFVTKLEREYKGYLFAVLLLWVLLIAYQFGRVASWAGATPAAPGVTPVAAATLREKLFALNEQDVPFTVKDGRVPNEVMVEWRYADAKWFDLMRVHGMTKTHRLALRLDEDTRRVRAVDYASEMDWSAGAGANAASLRWKAQMGITFYQYDYQKVLGFQFKDGRLTADTSYEYTFNLNEMKTPIIAIICTSGWDYRPVLTFWRPLGG